MKKFLILTVCITVGCVAILAITGIGIIQHINAGKAETADAIYTEVTSILAGYPNVPEEYGYVEICYNDGTNKYILIQNGDRVIFGVRSVDGTTVYCTEDKTWMVDTNGQLAQVDEYQGPARPQLESQIKMILSMQDITYYCEKNVGRDLIIDVPVGDWYIHCIRAGQEGWCESMACGKEDGGYLVWHVYPEGSFGMSILMTPELQKEPEGQIIISKWGEIPDAVYQELFA